MYGHRHDPNDPRPPHPSSYIQNYPHRISPSLSHGSYPTPYLSPNGIIPHPDSRPNGVNRYGHITLRPHSAFLQPQLATPPLRGGPELYRPSSGGSAVLLSDGRPWSGAGSPGYHPMTSADRDDILRGRSPGTRSSHSPIPNSQQSSRTSRVVSPIPPSQTHQDAPGYPLGPSLPSTMAMNQIQRSWTLDSPARSSLAPIEPTHSGRPLTRSPLLRAKSTEGSRTGYSEGGGAAPGRFKKERVGGPPKAKLGGPNGKTYEELRAGDSRIVSAPARTPPARRMPDLPAHREDEGNGDREKGEAKWGSKPVAVRLPPAETTRSHQTAKSGPPPEAEGRSSWPEYNPQTAQEGGQPDLPPNALGIEVPQRTTSAIELAAPQIKGERAVVVDLLRGDAFNKLSAGEKHRERSRARRAAMEGLDTGPESPPRPNMKRGRSSADWSQGQRGPSRDSGAGHVPYSSVSSSRQLSVAASPFQPVHPLPSSTTSQTEGDSRKPTPSPTKLRPSARPFEPSTYTRRVFTTPNPFPTDNSLRRSSADSGGSTAKRLRGNAAPFRPSGAASVIGNTTQSPNVFVNNPYTSLWAQGVASQVIHFGNGALGNDVSQEPELDKSVMLSSIGSNAVAKSTPKATNFALGSSSPSPSSTSMKRTASGKLRPAAPSFVPTGAFTFRSTASHSTGLSIGSSASAPQGTPTKKGRAASVVGDDAGQDRSTGNRGRSPASRLHNLSSSDSDEGIGPGREDVEAEPATREDEDGVESLSDSRYQAYDRSGAPSPPSRIGGRSSISQSRQIPAIIRMGNAHLPTESFGLPSPPTEARPDSTETSDVDGALQPSDIFTPLINAFPNPPDSARTFPADDIPPSTPVESSKPPLRESTTEPYETADGSPLVPRRYFETPATPHKTADVESKVPTLLSPTPARTRSRPTMLEHHSAPSAASLESPSTLIPTFARSEVKEDNASKDTKFRNWVFPASPTAPVRPSVVRRFTFPIPTQEHASLAGIASTAPIRESAPIPPATSTELGVMPTLSTRTSVEFPLRQEKRTLTIVNAVPDEEDGEDITARPSVSRLTSMDAGGQGIEVYLERIEGMLRDIKSGQGDAAVEKQEKAADVVLKLGEELAGMVLDMRNNFEDRLRLVDPPQPAMPNLQDELQTQNRLLAELLDRPHSPPAATGSSADTEQLNAAISTLIAGQTTLIDQIKSASEAQDSAGRETQTVIEAIRSMQEDLELRKSSEEKKDEVVFALRKQVEDSKAAETKVLLEKDQESAQLREVERVLQRVERERDEMAVRLRDIEEKERQAELKVDELKAGRMAILAERDGLAVGLRESFRRQNEAETEVDSLRGQLELEMSKADQRARGSEGSAGKLEALAADSKSFQDKLLQEVARLSREVGTASQAGKSEVEGLREDKRMLQNEVTELRKKTYEAASKIADADLRLATATNTSSAVEADLRRALALTEKGKNAAAKRISELEAGMERLKVEKTNMSMVATERSGAMRIMEIRHQALIQENVFWRDFALSYDRREHRNYTQSQPFRHPSISPATDQTPIQESGGRNGEKLLTPTNPIFGEKGGEMEGTPDLSMSTSSSAEGIVQDAQTPGVVGETRGEGTWWDVEK